MGSKGKWFLFSGIVLLAAAGGVGLLWPRAGRVAARIYHAWTLPVSTEEIPGQGTYTNIIFLHHSTGRQLLAGGDVRRLLAERGYQLWDHDYNEIGLTGPDGRLRNAQYRIPGNWGSGDTDIPGLARLLAQPVTSPPQNAFSRLLQHEVIILKSCFPNSAVTSETMLAEYQDYYRQMQAVMAANPDHIFILMSTPPLHPLATDPAAAARARQIADWLQSAEFQQGAANLFVFDYFDLLADPGLHTLRAAYQMTTTAPQSHPNQLAQETIGPLFAEFVDTAVQTYRQRQ